MKTVLKHVSAKAFAINHFFFYQVNKSMIS